MVRYSLLKIFNLFNKIRSLFFSLLFILSFNQVTSGQEASSYAWFDEVVGPSSTGLFNGVGYIEVHRTTNDNHKFFLTNEFISGDIIYDGQPYFGKLLKYNVFDGLLLIQIKDGENESLFQLINDKVDEFEIRGHRFINIKPGVDPNVQGFFEVLFEQNELQLLKKHSRRIIQHNNRRFFHYEFKPQQNDHQLKFKDQFYDIGSRRDLYKIFPAMKRHIRGFYASEKGLRNTNSDVFMIKLLQEINSKIELQKSTGI